MCYPNTMVGTWLRHADTVRYAYTASSRGTIRVSVSVSVGGHISAYLVNEEQMTNFDSRQPWIALAASEHDGPDHIVERRQLNSLATVYLLVRNRSNFRVEITHERRSVKPDRVADEE